MRIYNLLKAPEGLSYDEIDYEAVYQSGYTAGYDSGYTDGGDFCGEFSITPSSLVYPVSGGSKDIDIVVPSSWHIDDSDFEWEYETSSDSVGWTGFSAESLNRLEVSENAGEGDKELTITTPDLTDAPLVLIGSTAATAYRGYIAEVGSRNGKLKAEAGTEYGDFEKDIEIEQHVRNDKHIFGPSGGSIPIILDTDGSDLVWYTITLDFSFPAKNPWKGYTLKHYGLVSDLPRALTLTVPPYTEGLDDNFYRENGEIFTYYEFKFGPGGGQVIYPQRYSIVIQKPEAPSATALTFGIYRPCEDNYFESAFLYRGMSAITQTVVSPSGAASNLVYTSSNPTLATIDANGIITVTDSGFPVYEEIVFTVTDTVSNISASTTGFCTSVPTLWVPGTHNCPCGLPDECSCIPATGGTFNFDGYNFTCSDIYITTEWAIVSKPEWVTVSPSSGNMMCGGSGPIDLTVTVAANNSSSLRGGEIVLKENGPDEHQMAIKIEQEGLSQ